MHKYWTNPGKPGGRVARPVCRELEKRDNEHLDNLIRGSADRLDRRLRCVPRSRRSDPPIARTRCDLFNTPLCVRDADSLKVE